MENYYYYLQEIPDIFVAWVTWHMIINNIKQTRARDNKQIEKQQFPVTDIELIKFY
jgi:hypothetical protein